MDARKWRSRLHAAVEIAKDVWLAFLQDRMVLPAAAIAFYVTLSMLPFLLLITSVVTFFISTNELSNIGQTLTQSFGPGIGAALRQQVLSVVKNRGVLTGISLVLGLWAGSQVFVITQLALNQIWDVDDKRPFWVRRALALLMVLMTGVLLLAAGTLRYLTGLLATLDVPLVGYTVGHVPWFMMLITRFLLPWLIISLALAMLYRYLPAKCVDWRLVLPGAIIAGFLWMITLQVLSWYASTIGNYSILYGSLGGLILLMIWFNYSAVILLLGAEFPIAVRRWRAEERSPAARGSGRGESAA